MGLSIKVTSEQQRSNVREKEALSLLENFLESRLKEAQDVIIKKSVK